MLTALLGCLGGLGLFLFGMSVMTSGLRALGGPAQRRAIERFTKSPATGALTGAFLTAILQSSSATTLAAVGFVGAGLLTFSQALGLILGANVGTTATGWLVALIGFKWDIAAATSPLLFVGCLLRLTGRGRRAAIGEVLFGFALVFLGIQTLQHAMAGFEGRLLPDSLAHGGAGARLALVGLGALVTIVTQSSSAGVATALAALDAGTLEFSEAAALVIGMDVGTTATAALATIGGTLAMRRTGWAHVVFNVLSAIGALALLPFFARAIEAWRPGVTVAEPELSLVAFHTTFNVLSVLLALPFTAWLAALMERLVRARAGVPELEPRLLAEPALALHAATRSGLSALKRALRETGTHLDAELPVIISGLQTFVFQLAKHSPDERDDPRIAALMHLGDHLGRLETRRRRRAATSRPVRDPELARIAVELSEALAREQSAAPGAVQELEPALRQAARRFEEQYARLTERSDAERVAVIERAARGACDFDVAALELDAQRDLQRTAQHLWRAAHHAAEALQPGTEPHPFYPLSSPPSGALSDGEESG